MNTAIYVLAFICLAQLGIIFGLVNRLVRQAGQRMLSPQEIVRQAERAMVEKKPEHSVLPQRFGKKIGSTGNIDPVPSYMEKES